MNSAFSGAWSAPGGPSIPGFDDLNDGQVDSELRASGVKEFVPGRGWTTTSNESSKPQAPQAEPWRANNSVDAWSGDSDLNITAVKEFVPGQGWTAGGSSSQPGYSTGDSNDWQVQSALRPPGAKEFVPGQGLVAGNTLQSKEQVYPQSEPLTQEPGYMSVVPSGPLPAPPKSLRALDMADDLRKLHRLWQLEAFRQLDPIDPRHRAIPPSYCNPFPLDIEPISQFSFGYQSSSFQVVARDDGYLYCLRRYDNVNAVDHNLARTTTNRWKGLEHSHLVSLYSTYVTEEAFFFVYQYIPGVVRMRDRLVGSPSREEAVWSMICQLVSVIRKVHLAGMAVRTLDARHLLVQADSMRERWYVNCAGVPDALGWELHKSVDQLQVEDIRQLGYLIISWATGTEVNASTNSAAMGRCSQFFKGNFSEELCELAMSLTRSKTPPSITDLCRNLSGRIMDEMDHAELNMQRTERALGVEFEGGRMLQLLLKLSFANEQSEFDPNRQWAQSGDCYIVKLFRDFVFYQVDDDGNSDMDLGHVTMALAKLDAAAEEEIYLTSRDGESSMVVSYASVARCLESVYQELCANAAPQQPY